ncbi:MAG: hypothetical protein LC734_06170 [Acidobacteria bacterium]|nr:hypothetical protein [Acidobacteriota bacterium]
MVARDNYLAPADFVRYRTIALGLGGIALLVWAIGLYIDTEQALRSWLIGFIFWAGLCFGSLGLLMLQYLTGGAWGVVIRRILEAATRTLPLIVVLFLPIAIGVTQLYEWTHLPPDDYTVQHRGAYMTPLWWIVRSAVYFALFGVMVYLLNHWSARQDASDDYETAAGYLERASRFSGPTMVFFVLTCTFASVDWVMTLTPHWFSTIWGLLFVIGWVLSTMCFTVILLASTYDLSPMNRVLGRRHFHDLGKLMLAFVMVWTYFNLSQYLIIWAGNIPEETTWYIDRMRNGWGIVAWMLILFHFAFPFLILLQQDFKRRPRQLAAIGAFIILMRFVDLYFLIGPSPRIEGHGMVHNAVPHWLDFVAPIAVGGIWLWYFFGQLAKRPMVPVMDPFFERAVDHGKGH